MQPIRLLAIFGLLVAFGGLVSSCGRSGSAGGGELVGSWKAERVTTKRAGHPDEARIYNDNTAEVTLEFGKDKTFAMVDRSKDESISSRGTYEIIDGHLLKEVIVAAEGGPKFITDRLVGLKPVLEFSLSGDKLTLSMRLAGADGKETGQMESVFVRVSRQGADK